uniref:Uncharacterized protein n=1 Tax=Tanacetum cinerariifolium TaxID=118510 RepID=A0A6L2L718_TANCI|nr:hypothetical protein [Tanacetum cinerariifolium]
MATTIEQLVVLDEALVPSTKRLRIGRSNFRLPSDIQSKEPTLQVGYDEFWATAYVHQHSIKFKMESKKNIVDMEAFKEMLHISPRVPGQSFDDLPFEEEILDFLRFLGHSAQIKTLTDVNINKLFQPWRSFAAVINNCLTGKSSGFDSFRHQNTQQYGTILPIELTNEDIRNTKAYKEYYACATREAAPKLKASARRKRGGSDSSTTPPTAAASPRPITTVAAAPRLIAAAKGKQPARATSPNDPSKVERTEMKELVQDGGSKPGVPDVPSDDSEEEISWNSSDDEDVDDQDKGRDDDEGEKNDESDADDDVQDDAERDDDDDGDDDEEEIAKLDKQEDTESGEGDDEETETDGENSKDNGNSKEGQRLRVSEEQRLIEEEEVDELYRDQESSSVSSFVTSMLNPISDAGVESIFTTASSPIEPLQTSTPIMTPSTIATITTSSDEPIPSTTIPSATNQFAEAVSNIPGIVHQYMTKKITEAVQEAVQIQTDRLQDSFQRENDEFLRTIDENMKKIIKGQVKSQVKEPVSRIISRIKEFVNAQLEAEVLTRSSHSSRTSYAVAADLIEMEPKKILIEKMEGNKSIQRSDEQQNLYKAMVDAYEAYKTILESYGDTAILKRRRGDDDDQEGPSAGSDRGSKGRREGGEPESASTPSEPATRSASRSTTETQSRHMSASESAFAEEPVQTTCQMDEPPHPVFETELEYHLEEVYKATTDQLDWVNPEDYGHIKWIEDLVPRTMWIQEPLNYDKHALWGVSHWGRKRQQFYGFTVNRESALDVYSKRRIIAVTDLKIVKWHNYKHLDWISVRRDDDKIYKFKEGDFKRLRLQDIEDMLLLLVQGKLSNLTVKERFAFNVSLRMFTRSIVIQRRMEDLQLRVEIYQKRLNLTNPDTKGDKDRAAAMIQSIDKMLKTRRIMKSLERFVRGRLYGKKEKSEKLGRVPTEMELILEHTQQGISYEVSVSAEGVEELKRNDQIKGVKKEPLLIHSAETGSIHTLSETLSYCLDNDDDDDDDEEEISKVDEQEATESDDEDDGNSDDDQGLRISEEERIQEEEKADELYRDVDINQGRGLQVSQDIEDYHVTLTTVQPDGQQESLSVSSFVTSMLNPTSDAGVESIFTTASSPIAPLPTTTPIMTPSTIATITTSSDAPIPLTTIPSTVLENLPTFDSVFRFEDRVKSLEVNFSEFMQTNQFADAVSKISENDEFLRTIDENMKKIIKGQVKSQVKEQVSRILPRIEESVNAQLEAEVLTRSSNSSRTSYAVVADLTEMELKKILIEKMEGNKSIQRSDEQRNLYKDLVDAYEADKTILESYGDTAILKRRREDDDDQEGPSAGSDRGSKRRREGGEHESASTPSEPTTRSASRSTTGTQSRQMSASESAFAEEPVQTTCQMDEPPHPVFECVEDQPIVQTSQHPEWFSQPRKPPTPDRYWNKTLPAIQGNAQTWISDLAKQADSRSSFNELIDTPIDFSNFIMNRLCVDTLTPELLAGPTFELMRGSCTSLTELEYHLKEVYKATTDQLDWVNPEGQPYPHNLLQPLPLIPDNRGRRVIPFKHFINNDLEYLQGGASSRKYTTSVTKTKAADYGHIK